MALDNVVGKEIVKILQEFADRLYTIVKIRYPIAMDLSSIEEDPQESDHMVCAAAVALA
jgi:hypothetical protein